MADEAIVREEVWFDSSDGTSRVHGYVWWPEGTAGDADGPQGVSSSDANAASDDSSGQGRAEDADGTPASGDAGHAVALGDDGAADYRIPRHAATQDAGEGDLVDEEDHEVPSGEEGSDAAGEQQTLVVANALERAARSVAMTHSADASRPDSVESAQDGALDDGGGHPGALPDGAPPSRGRRVVDGLPEVDLDETVAERADVAVPDDTVWAPDVDDGVEVKGIVQLVHGMAEHIGRYDEFARFLASHGYVVCGHDHIGHGKSAERDRLGCLPARNGKAVLVDDVGRLRAVMQERMGEELPYFLFGHSLGSFVVRSYIAREGAGLAGAVICGTGHVSPSKSSLGHFASRLLGLVHGQYGKSGLLHSMGVGAYAKSVKHRRTPNDWLSYNESNVDAYNADELCGFPFSAGGYATVTALTKEVCAPAWASRVPRLMPLLFIGGNADPVGDNGEGVRMSARLVRDAGCADVTCMIYKRMRHEILNEDDRQMVFDDVLFWLEVRS